MLQSYELNEKIALGSKTNRGLESQVFYPSIDKEYFNFLEARYDLSLLSAILKLNYP